MKRSHLLPVLLWTLLWALFFGTLLLAIERLPNSDLSGQFHAFGLFQSREISAGRLPIWSPGSYGGVPFAADTQAAVFYPPRWLTILFSLPGGFSYYVLELEGLLHIWLSGLFVYFLAFDITHNLSKYGKSEDSPQLSMGNKWAFSPAHWAGLLAAVAFGLGGYLTSYPLLQLAVLESVAWLPLVLWLLRQGVRTGEGSTGSSPRQIPALLAAGVVLGISALAGHPQTFLHVAYLAAAYFLFLAWQARWRWSWVVGLGIMVTAVAVGVAMPAFLPAARFLPYTIRDEISYEFLAKGFSLLEYAQIFIPGPLSVWLPQYTGLVTVFLAVLAWYGRARWPERQQQAETVFWVGVVLVAAWLSLGDKGILLELVYRIAPGFSLFRQQERLVSLVSLALALLGAQGLALWLHAKSDERRQLVRKAGTFITFGLLLVGFIFLLTRTVNGQNDWLALWGRQWLLLVLLIALLWPFNTAFSRKGNSWRSLALIVLLFLDLFPPLRQAMNLQQESPVVFWPQPGWLEPLLAIDSGRFDGQNLFHANLGELYGLEDIKGISPLKPQFLADFEKLDRPRRWQLLNVQHVLAPKRLEESLTEIGPIDQSILPGQGAEGFVYRFEDALPRAWMVYELINSANSDEAFTVVRGADFDPATQVVLTNPDPSNFDVVAPSDAPPHVAIEQLPGSGLLLTVETGSPGILVLSEWALPGWQATIDGQDASLLTADYSLLGLNVPQGRHEIILRYTSLEVQAGLIVALATLLLAAVVAWRWRPAIPIRNMTDSAGVMTQPQEKRPIQVPMLTIAQARWLMAGVILLGFGLRMFLLGNQELRGDEAFSFLFTQLPIAEVIPELIDQGDPHSPLHYLTLNAWVDLAGESELAMRYLSLLPGVFLLPFLFQLGREMTGRKLGLLAALLAAISPSLIWLSQDVRNQYTLAVLFTTAATWLLVKASTPSTNASAGPRLRYWVLYVLLGTLSIYGHYYALFALLAHGLYLWFSPGRRRFLMPWAVSGIVVFLFFLSWLFVVMSGLLEAGQLSDPGNPELTAHLVSVGRELVSGSTLRGGWTRWLFLGALFFVLLGFADLRSRKPGWAAMLAGWFGGAALSIFLVRFSRSTFNEFYISVAAPAWILLLAAGVSVWWRRGGWRRIMTFVMLLVLIGATVISLSNHYFDPSYSRTLGYRKMAAYVDAQAKPGDLFITHFPDPALDYYLRDVSMPRRLNPQTTGMSDADVEQALFRLLEEYDRAWFVPYNHSVWDRENVVPRWLDYHLLHEEQAQLDRLTLQAFRSQRTASEVVHPLDLAIEDELSLDSTYVTVDGRPVDLQQPLTVAGGSTVKVSLLWSAQQKLGQDYTAFVHLLDDNGLLIAQHDGIPVSGTRPTTSWQEGEKLLDRHELILPEHIEGNGRLIVGLYDTVTLERREFNSGQDEILLQDVVFK